MWFFQAIILKMNIAMNLVIDGVMNKIKWKMQRQKFIKKSLIFTNLIFLIR